MSNSTRSPTGDAPPLAESGDGVAAVGQRTYTRRLVVFCCEDNSVLGRPEIAEDCEVIRLTLENDLRTKAGLEAALDAVNTELPCLLWASIPCDGGTPFHYLSKDWDTDEFQEKLNKKRADAKKMWYNFVKVARKNRDNGGRCAIEWPLKEIHRRVRPGRLPVRWMRYGHDGYPGRPH